MRLSLGPVCPEHCVLTGLDCPAAYNIHHIQPSPGQEGQGQGCLLQKEIGFAKFYF